MTIKAWPPKDPNAKLRHYFDFSAFVADEASALASYAIAQDEPADGTLVLSDDASSGSIVMVWIAGGTVGQEYTIRCRATLANGSIDDMSRILTIEQR